jgi:tetratricopeptide (TPR) repeat protein
VTFLEEGNPQSAALWLGRANALRPHEPRILLGLATAYFESGRDRLAQQVIEELIALQDVDFPLLMATGRLLARYGRTQQAIQVFALAQRRAPPTVEGEKSTLYFERLLAVLYERSKEAEAAIENLQSLVQSQPNNPDNYYRLTLMLAKMGRFSQATEIAQGAFEKFPRSPQIVLAYALASYFSGHNDKAEDAYHQLIQLEPNSDQPYFALGNFYADVNRLSDAVEAFKVAISNNPRNYLNHYMCGVALFRLGKLQEARRALNEALRLNPRHADSYYWLGRIDVRQGKNTDALRNFKIAIKLQPNHNSAYYQLGLLYAHMGDKKDSQKMFQIQRQLNIKAHGGIVAERMP